VHDVFSISSKERSANFASDLGAIGLTISGFILTLITILLTLKSSQLLQERPLTNASNPFQIFLASALYMKSIHILEHGVLSLVFISLILYTSKLILQESELCYIYYIDIVDLIIILSTFLRCFYVISLIMKMQQTPQEQV
jgi:hypothetical protein